MLFFFLSFYSSAKNGKSWGGEKGAAAGPLPASLLGAHNPPWASFSRPGPGRPPCLPFFFPPVFVFSPCLPSSTSNYWAFATTQGLCFVLVCKMERDIPHPHPPHSSTAPLSNHTGSPHDHTSALLVMLVSYLGALLSPSQPTKVLLIFQDVP